MNANRFFLATLAAIALAVGVYLGQKLQAPQGPPSLAPTAHVLPQARPLPNLTLTDYNGQPFAVEQLKGGWSFLFFGYTFCPDVCPMALHHFQEVATGLDEAGDMMKDTRFIFVSVDPDRDKPERLKEYVQFFDKRFLGVTAEKRIIDALSAAMGVVYMKVDNPNGGDYLVDHSSAVLLVNPQGRLHAVLPVPHVPADIVRAYQTTREYYQ